MNATTSGSGSAQPRGAAGQATKPGAGAAMASRSGALLFAFLMFIAAGAFQLLEGIAALARGSFFVVTSSYVYRVDVTVWGWIHVALGIIFLAVGAWVLGGSVPARYVAMGMAVLSSVAHFLFIPYQPIWSVLVITVNVIVIWALAGRFEQERF